MAEWQNQDDLVDVDLEEDSVWQADHPRDSRWKLGAPVGCTEYGECSGVSAAELVEEEKLTQRKETTEWRSLVRIVTLVETQKMVVAEPVVEV